MTNKQRVLGAWERQLEKYSHEPQVGMAYGIAGSDFMCKEFAPDTCFGCPLHNPHDDTNCNCFELQKILWNEFLKNMEYGKLKFVTGEMIEIVSAHHEFLRQGITILQSLPDDRFDNNDLGFPELKELDEKLYQEYMEVKK